MKRNRLQLVYKEQGHCVRTPEYCCLEDPVVGKQLNRGQMLVPINSGSCYKLLVIFPKFDAFSGVILLKSQYKFSYFNSA